MSGLVLDYLFIEDFVDNSSSEVIRQSYDLAEDQEQEDWRIAIMVAISMGDRKDLEVAFPKLSVANPSNHIWA